MQSSGNGWGQYEKYVLAELKRLGSMSESCLIEISHVRTDIATLKVKAGLLGGIVGAILTALMSILLQRI